VPSAGEVSQLISTDIARTPSIAADPNIATSFSTRFSHGEARILTKGKSETSARFQYPEKLKFCVPQQLLSFAEIALLASDQQR
jgi:hypothetical protein